MLDRQSRCIENRRHRRERPQANHRQRGHPFNRAPGLGKSPQECFMKTSNRERSFPFLTINERERKPRKRGLTEIRGPYYSVVGRRYLEDLFETMGAYVDSLKFAGGSFTLMPERAVRAIIEFCHKHDVLVSTGGFIERVLAQGHDAAQKYVAECKKLGFDTIEISAGFISIPTDDWLRLIELVRKSGL